jgi:hypothetical protein
MPPERAHSTTTCWLAYLLGAALLLVVVSCGSDSWGVKESDVPSEATLAFPGSQIRSRGWNPGDKGTYIDGGSADYAPRLALAYDVAPTAPEELLQWYTDQLQGLGYTIEKTELPSAGFGEAYLGAASRVDDFDVRFGVKGVLEDDGTVILYRVTVVVTPA